MNNVVISGRLTKEPHMTSTNGGTPISQFRLAVNRGFGEKRKTSFIPVTAFGGLAENCGRNLIKGSQVIVNGEINMYQTVKDGISKEYMEVIANTIEFIGKRPEVNEQTA